ncbi:putative Dynein intermediate chain 3, ciliary [Blattamonas nauphoetae]|uniref:Dynein intermediate chain 3, ciliary n=1 Tax=Blattamonas nauphoetae TaxID=2049346 RepID=A0ABQ9YHX6_9EUKA|nr:putative Dynein intermediate chain 3, ciliary [Blattamonas nauphoetae]
MTIDFQYSRKRRDFGKPCHFSLTHATILFEAKHEPDKAKNWITSQTVSIKVQCSPEFSEHSVNTDHILLKSKGMNHIEGAWPKDIDPNEPDHMNMFRRKIETDDNYKTQLRALSDTVDHSLKINNTLDIYTEEFEDCESGLTLEPPQANLLTVLRDPEHAQSRFVNRVSWHPENPAVIAVAYTGLESRNISPVSSSPSFIWDFNHQDSPIHTLAGASPLCCTKFNPKDANILVSGCTDGLVSFFDTRKDSRPYETSPVNHCHRDFVTDVYWLASKTGNEICSVSPDSFAKFWDVRKLSEPYTIIKLINNTNNTPVGATSLDFDPRFGPSKFLVGTEQGQVLSCNQKGKKQTEQLGLPFFAHVGPVYGVCRNPANPKYFISFGDVSAKIWVDDDTTPKLLATGVHTEVKDKDAHEQSSPHGPSANLQRKPQFGAQPASFSFNSLSSPYGTSPHTSFLVNPPSSSGYVSQWGVLPPKYSPSPFALHWSHSSPILSTPFIPQQFITSGQWSPTKPTIALVGSSNGNVSFWDVVTQQTLLQVKVQTAGSRQQQFKEVQTIQHTKHHSDQRKDIASSETSRNGIFHIETHPSGQFFTAGLADGTTNLFSLSSALSQPRNDENRILNDALDREVRREAQTSIMLDVFVNTNPAAANMTLPQMGGLSPFSSRSEVKITPQVEKDDLDEYMVDEEEVRRMEQEFFEKLTKSMDEEEID